MKTESLKLSKIVTTAGTQIRAKIDGDTVEDYSIAMRDGAKFPPVVVFHDGSEYILADGFHRVMAASRNGFLDILAEVRKGTKSDALKYALTANIAHGLKRTNADKRRSAMLAIDEWPTMSNVAVAELCGVGKDLVLDVRQSQVAESATSATPAKRTGRDGKQYPATKPKRTKPEPAPEPEQPEPTDTGYCDDPPRVQTATEILEPMDGLVSNLRTHIGAIRDDLDIIESDLDDGSYTKQELIDAAKTMEMTAAELRKIARGAK